MCQINLLFYFEFPLMNSGQLSAASMRIIFVVLLSGMTVYNTMGQVRAVGGNTKCILCNASYTTSDEFSLIDSTRGTDLKTLVYNVLGVKPIDGVLCRKRCKKKLTTLERTLKVFRRAISLYTYQVKPVMYRVHHLSEGCLYLFSSRYA